MAVLAVSRTMNAEKIFSFNLRTESLFETEIIVSGEFLASTKFNLSLETVSRKI